MGSILRMPKRNGLVSRTGLIKPGLGLRLGHLGSFYKLALEKKKLLM